MSGNYYDVVVLGLEMGPLCAGALLAKRGFRVLVVGQDAARDLYSCCGFQFVKRPFVLTGATSPVVSRVVDELSIGQLFSHAESPAEVKYQVVQPHARVNVFGDIKKTKAELQREFSIDGRVIDDIINAIGRYCGDFEKLIDSDLVIPPETFFERRDFSRALVQHPFLSQIGRHFVDEIGVDGNLADFFMAPLRSCLGETDTLAPLLEARGIGSWLFDARYIRGGRDGLRQLLCARIIEQGGDVQEQFVVDGIDASRGRVHKVHLRGRSESVATRVVLTDLFPGQLSQLLETGDWTGRFKALVDDAGTYALGYAVNLGVKREVIPSAMSQTVFQVSSSRHQPSHQLPHVLRIEQVPQRDSSLAALHISCVVPAAMQGAIESGALRDTILDRVRMLIPYLDQYLDVIHSPYDRFGTIDLTGAAGSSACVAPYPEQVPRMLIQQPRMVGGLGIENMLHRTGIKGLLFAGTQVNAGLGLESDFISGWGAAKIIARQDPGRQRLIRSVRSRM